MTMTMRMMMMISMPYQKTLSNKLEISNLTTKISSRTNTMSVQATLTTLMPCYPYSQPSVRNLTIS